MRKKINELPNYWFPHKYPITHPVYDSPVSLSQFISYLLRDEFKTDRAAGAVNGTNAEPGSGVRTVRDVESKIALSSGWCEWTAQATAAYADQDLVFATPSIVRAAGKMLLNKWRCATDNSQYPLAWVSSGTPTWNHTNVIHGLWRSGALVLSTVNNETVGPQVCSFVADGTIYKLAIIQRATGAFYFIKGGSFTNWTLLYIGTTGNTTPVYAASAGYTAAFSTDAYSIPTILWLPSPLASDGFGSTFGQTDGLGHAEGVTGGIGSGGSGKTWTGATWATAGGVVFNAPVAGTETVNDPGLEAAYTGGLCDSLGIIAGAPTVADAGAGAHSGSHAQQITATAKDNRINADTAPSVSNNTWYRGSIWTKRTAGVAGGSRVRFLNSNESVIHFMQLITEAAWTNTLFVFRTSSTVVRIDYIYEYAAGPAWDTVIVDDFSLKPLTTAQLFSSLTPGSSNVFAKVDATIGNYFEGGIVLNLNSATTPTNFILCYYNIYAGKVYLDKCLAGTYTNLLAVTATYAAGATVAVRKVGLSYYVWYNGAYIGNWTANAGTDANIVNNTLHGLFSTGNGAAEVSLDNFVVYASGIIGEYSYLDNF